MTECYIFWEQTFLKIIKPVLEGFTNKTIDKIFKIEFLSDFNQKVEFKIQFFLKTFFQRDLNLNELKNPICLYQLLKTQTNLMNQYYNNDFSYLLYVCNNYHN